MDLFEFINRFPGEKECLDYFIAAREKAGIICAKCGNSAYTWEKQVNQFECTNCQNRINIKARTAMENSKLSIKYWFMAIHLLTSPIKDFTISAFRNKFNDADYDQIDEMFRSLESFTTIHNHDPSFDELLLNCVATNKSP